MKRVMNRRIYLRIILPGLLLALSLTLSWYLLKSNATSPASIDRPQCAHWSVFRCCQLLGAPVGMQTVVNFLPPHPKGHSLLEVSEVLEKIGFVTEGRHETRESLKNFSFPCIAHLVNPDHYIVITSIDDNFVHVFDGEGRRSAREWQHFFRQWDGILLTVQRSGDNSRLPRFLPITKENSPAIQFDRLVTDLGTVPVIGRSVEFSFPFRNLGNADLVIEEARPGCSCIESHIPSQPIPPGGEGVLSFSYHVEAKKGPFSHDIIVKSNDTQIPNILLTTSGWSGIEMRLNPTELVLSKCIQDHSETLMNIITYTGDVLDFSVTVDHAPLSNAEVITSRIIRISSDNIRRYLPDIQDTNRPLTNIFVLETVVKPTGSLGDKVEGKIELTTNVAGYEHFTLNVFGTISRPIAAYPDIVDFSVEDFTKKLERKVRLLSKTGSAFRIRNVELPVELISFETREISSHEIEMTFHRLISEVSAASSENIIIEIEFLDSKAIYTFPIRVLFFSPS